ncbi:MAG: glycosyltransferase [Burkholderiales bacterium]|nr:glycosyltransferase [Anaerolineae bacterium]
MERQVLERHAKPFVTVIIPVYNDAERLELCLQALDGQTYPSDQYEIIVVDNASDESVAPIVEQHPKARLIFEAVRTQFAARNTAIAVAKGDLMAFSDSDCIPEPDWVENGVNCLLSVPNCGMVGGRVKLFAENPQHPTIAELYEMVTAFPMKRYIEQEHFAPTANMFTKREVFEKVGGFNATLVSGGDHEWGKRVHTGGFVQLYSHETVILHPARPSISELRRKALRVIRGLHDIYSGKKPPLSFRAVLREIRPPLYVMRQMFNAEELQEYSQWQRVRVGILAMYIKYLRNWEKRRLQIRDKLLGRI